MDAPWPGGRRPRLGAPPEKVHIPDVDQRTGMHSRVVPRKSILATLNLCSKESH